MQTVGGLGGITKDEAVIETMNAVGMHDWYKEKKLAGIQVVGMRRTGLPHMTMWITGCVSDVYVVGAEGGTWD